MLSSIQDRQQLALWRGLRHMGQRSSPLGYVAPTACMPHLQRAWPPWGHVLMHAHAPAASPTRSVQQPPRSREQSRQQQLVGGAHEQAEVMVPLPVWNMPF